MSTEEFLSSLIKMNYNCEADVTVSNENAVRFSTFAKPPPVLEYINSIASLVGTSHILAVFEDNDSIKVYFDDKKFVDTFIKKGLHVCGRHVKVDYVVPPGLKLILSNIDPVISNFDLIRLLSMFGKIVSPIIPFPLSDDTKLCHIMGGVRCVYMILDKTIPEKLDFKYGNQFCTLDVKIESTSKELPFIKTDSDSDVDFEDEISNSAPDPPAIENSQSQEVMDPVVVSVHCAPLEDHSNTQESDRTGDSVDSDSNTPSTAADSNHSTTDVPLGIKYSYKTYKMKRRRWLNSIRVNKVNHIAKARKFRQKRQMPLQSSATSDKSVISASVKSSPIFLKMNCTSPSLKENVSPEISRRSTSLNENASPENNYDCVMMKEEALTPRIEKGTNSENNQSSPLVIKETSSPVLQNETLPFSDEELLEFLNQLKYHREPLKLAMMYLGTKNTEALRLLVMQLEGFRRRQNSVTLRLRLNRLIKLLSQAF